MRNNNSFEAIERLCDTLSHFNNILNSSNMENYSRLVERISKIDIPDIAIREAVGRQATELESLNVPVYECPEMMDALTKKWDVLAQIANTYKTPEIATLEKSMLNNESMALKRFADTLSAAKHIEAPNVALLRLSPILRSTSLPKGMATVINNMHIGTAKVLSNSESVSYNVDSRMFYVEQSPNDAATVSETNILCSSMQLLSGIDEADLILFLNYLDKHLPFASTHFVGERINNIIAGWEETMDFDRDVYYHARTLPIDKCPYTERDMRQAPSGVSWHGRFNYVGQSHYYFSDEQVGALLEAAKHSNEKRVQVARLRPMRSIRMIDLSSEITTQNKFLEYCRFSPEPQDYPNIKREYLLPCYVASCCELHGIEGIKYYGSKEYKNYVSWNDGYFEFVDSEILFA